MTWIYVAATIFGGAFLIPMVLGGLTSDLDGGFGGGVDADLDMDVEVDMDLDVDMDMEVDAEVGSDLTSAGDSVDGGLFDADLLGTLFSSLLSFRTIVFFSAFFGSSGLVFGALGYRSGVTLGTAILIGVIAAVANSMLFGLIKNSQANSQISDRTLEGRPATVVLPMSSSQRGRIRIELSGQPQYMVARPIDGLSSGARTGEPEQEIDVGVSVVVVKIEDGTAHVALLPELDLGEES